MLGVQGWGRGRGDFQVSDQQQADDIPQVSCGRGGCGGVEDVGGLQGEL